MLVQVIKQYCFLGWRLDALEDPSIGMLSVNGHTTVDDLVDILFQLVFPYLNI